MLDMEARRSDPARIAVIGLGGGGSNAVNRMIQEGLRDVTFWVANTDIQALENSICSNRIQLGVHLTGGLGAGGDPDIGRAAAEEDQQTLSEVLEGYDMVFLTAGMGGGTGTGSAPVVAHIARSIGALTVAIVTRPFSFENVKRMTRAEEGVRQLADEVDTLIVIPNDKLLHLVERNAPLNAGLRVADEVLFQATRGIADIIVGNGLINVDFADVRTVMRNRGAALLGSGIASGENRAIESAQAAVSSPLLDDLSIQGAEAMLVNIVGGPDMGFHEVTEAAQYISQQAGKDSDVFWGAVVDPNMTGEMRVTLIATGFQRPAAIRKVERVVATPARAAASSAPSQVAAAAQSQTPVLTPSQTPVIAPAQIPAMAPLDMPEPIAIPRIVPLPAAPDPHTAGTGDPMWNRSGIDAAEPAAITTPWIDERSESVGETAEEWSDGEPEIAPPTPIPAVSEPVDRGPALWRRTARRLQFPDRLDDSRLGGKNRLDIPTFLRKQMD
jgi:cell division protein FtsZ